MDSRWSSSCAPIHLQLTSQLWSLRREAWIHTNETCSTERSATWRAKLLSAARSLWSWSAVCAPRPRAPVRRSRAAMAGELILVIEDNKKNLKLVRDLLQFNGFLTLEATTAEHGLVLAAQQCPRLILADIQLPDMDGVAPLGLLPAD